MPDYADEGWGGQAQEGFGGYGGGEGADVFLAVLFPITISLSAICFHLKGC